MDDRRCRAHGRGRITTHVVLTQKHTIVTEINCRLMVFSKKNNWIHTCCQSLRDRWKWVWVGDLDHLDHLIKPATTKESLLQKCTTRSKRPLHQTGHSCDCIVALLPTNSFNNQTTSELFFSFKCGIPLKDHSNMVCTPLWRNNPKSIACSIQTPFPFIPFSRHSEQIDSMKSTK